MPLPKTWRTREGTEIKIKKMSTSHIFNCMALLLRTAPARKEREELWYINAPGPNGDMAQLAVEQEFDALLDQTPDDWAKEQPHYQAFKRELIKRGEFDR